MKASEVIAINIKEYHADQILKTLPEALFSVIEPGFKVVIKPNWVRQSHQTREADWEYVITHPAVMTAVIMKVVDRLQKGGSILIVDGPETPSSFPSILSRYPVSDWEILCNTRDISFQIIDLRDDEWIVNNNVIVKRNKLSGDPLGKAETNLRQNSEFHGHTKSKRGYYGADYNIKETNLAHNGIDNIYRVSKSVLASDVFINLPKLKTHKKSGITCSLKNLVGVNTYKNYLPHYTIGGPYEGGDQFPIQTSKNQLESGLLYYLKQYLLIHPNIAKIINPFFKTGKRYFGETNKIIRSGNWIGNDTLWRMILDLNKIVLYADKNGLLKEDRLSNRKSYISIVDAVLCGEGNGPKLPEPKHLGYVICGINPVATDIVAASLMNFDPLKIPVIVRSFKIKNYKIVDFEYDDIRVNIGDAWYPLPDLPNEFKRTFKPHFGWNDLLKTD